MGSLANLDVPPGRVAKRRQYYKGAVIGLPLNLAFEQMRYSSSEARKTAYYFGNAVVMAGSISLLSVVVTGIAVFGESMGYGNDAKSIVMRTLVGMILVMAGVIVRSFGL